MNNSDTPSHVIVGQAQKSSVWKDLWKSLIQACGQIRLLPGLIQANVNILKDGYSRTAEKQQYENNRNVENVIKRRQNLPRDCEVLAAQYSKGDKRWTVGWWFSPHKVLGIGKEGGWGCDGSDTKCSNSRHPGECVEENQKGTAGWEWKGALLEPGRCNKTCCKKVKENKE